MGIDPVGYGFRRQREELRDARLAPFPRTEYAVKVNRQEYYFNIIHLDLQRMIRADDYKLIVYPYAGIKRLFHLKDDPEEMNDLASLPEHQKRVTTMFDALDKLRIEMGYTLDLKAFKYR